MEFKTELLKGFVAELKQNGFKVYVVDDNKPITFINFEKGFNVGYVQDDYFGGLNFSSVHKPSQGNGTGFQIHKEIIKPTIQHALDCFDKPYWAKGNILKWKSFDEYRKSPIGSILKYIEA